MFWCIACQIKNDVGLLLYPVPEILLSPHGIVCGTNFIFRNGNTLVLLSRLFEVFKHSVDKKHITKSKPSAYCKKSLFVKSH